MQKGKSWEWMVCYLFLLPNIILYILVRLVPFLATVGLSFTNWRLIGSPEFVGLSNFIDLWHYRPFWRALQNTFLYALYVVPPSLFLGLLLAVLVNREIPGIRLFRALYFLPYVTSVVFVAVVWRWLFSVDLGLINELFRRLGLPAVEWLASPRMALPSLALVAIWQNISFNMLIFLAGLQGIAKDCYESAVIDGATKIQSFFSITVPLLKPVALFAAVMTTIGSFQVFDLTYVMTQGGPLDSTLTLVYYLYDHGFRYMRMGHASAVALVLFLLIFTLSVLQRKLFAED